MKSMTLSKFFTIRPPTMDVHHNHDRLKIHWIFMRGCCIFQCFHKNLSKITTLVHFIKNLKLFFQNHGFHQNHDFLKNHWVVMRGRCHISKLSKKMSHGLKSMKCITFVKFHQNPTTITPPNIDVHHNYDFLEINWLFLRGGGVIFHGCKAD